VPERWPEQQSVGDLGYLSGGEDEDVKR
jgi:hypothetical protein